MTAPDGRLSAREFLPWLERECPTTKNFAAVRKSARSDALNEHGASVPHSQGTVRQKATGLQSRSRGEQS